MNTSPPIPPQKGRVLRLMPTIPALEKKMQVENQEFKARDQSDVSVEELGFDS